MAKFGFVGEELTRACPQCCAERCRRADAKGGGRKEKHDNGQKKLELLDNVAQFDLLEQGLDLNDRVDGNGVAKEQIGHFEGR